MTASLLPPIDFNSLRELAAQPPVADWDVQMDEKEDVGAARGNNQNGGDLMASPEEIGATGRNGDGSGNGPTFQCPHGSDCLTRQSHRQIDKLGGWIIAY